MGTDLTVDFDPNEDGDESFLTIGSSDFLVQVQIAREELPRLRKARHADWNLRQSVAAGRCLGKPVHWTAGPNAGTPEVHLGGTPEEAPVTLGLSEEALVALEQVVTEYGR